MLAMVLASSARAQTLDVSVTSGAPDLGTVIKAASGDTVFRVTPQGAVTRQSGTGVRQTSGNASSAVVTVSCTGGGTGNNNKNCANNDVFVKIGPSTATLPARAPTNFTVDMGTATLMGSVSGSGSTPVTFKISAVPQGNTRTFRVGMDVGVAGANSSTVSGDVSSAFYVWVGFTSPTGSIGDTGAALMRVFRPIAVAKTADLTFGRVVKPISGSGGVLSITSNGARVVSGGAVILNSTFSRAAYNVTGEGGQTLDVQVPASFDMTNGASSLTVTTNTTAVGITGLTGNLGASGAYTFYVGGTFPIDPATPTGAYTGTFPVTVAYN